MQNQAEAGNHYLQVMPIWTNSVAGVRGGVGDLDNGQSAEFLDSEINI